MCRVCTNSLFINKISFGDTDGAPSRREFIAYLAAATAAATTLAARYRADAAGTADVIFRNGTILPVSGQKGAMEALAIGGGTILAVGSASDVFGLNGSATKIVDLQGRTLMPGLVDPHHHTVLSAVAGNYLTNVGYANYRARADALEGLKEATAKTPPGQWVRGGYYDNILQGGDLSIEMLDAVSTQHPIFVIYVNGHTGAANSAAFKLANVTRDTGGLPGGGRFGHAPDGKLNGLIYEEPALLRFADLAIPKTTPEMIAQIVTSYTKQVAAVGNTTLHEPGTIKPDWVQSLAKLSNTLDMRLSASLSTDSIEESKTFAALGPGSKARVIPGSRFSLYGIKFWADGSNQQETAAQTIPYLNSTSKGQTDYTETQMAQMCGAAKNAGWPILVHCQGDASVDDVLDAIEAVYGANPPTGLNRIEHATLARQDQFERMKRLGVEPSFLMSLLRLYGAAYRDDILGPARTSFLSAAGACVKLGLPFSLHTDSPAGPIGSLSLVQTAVTRVCETDGSVIGDDQAIALDEALMAVTIRAARQIGLEDAIGSLEAGKQADLTILESDPYKTEPAQIGAIKISETWVAGLKKFGS